MICQSNWRVQPVEVNRKFSPAFARTGMESIDRKAG
jgi:hypothetical protein